MGSKAGYKKDLGRLGEDAAAGFLAAEGFAVLARNYRSGRMGEIDIIAAEKEYICFIEVKTRTASIYGAPCEAVGFRKQAGMRRLAWTYLKQRGLTDRDMRFDIVEVTCRRNEDRIDITNINLIRNAF